MAIATNVIATAALLLVEDVVLVVLDGLGGEDAVDLVAAWVLVGPGFNGLEHVALDFDTIAAESGVVEGLEDIVNDLVDRHVGVLPSYGSC